MKTYDAKDIRNVLLVGHGGSGKTTLLEAMLFASGAITRMGTVEDGNTVSDFDAEEQRRQISVSLSLTPIEWNDVKINVLDAPGYADFVGDVRSAVRAADAVIVVVSAVDGVEVQTEVVWELAVRRTCPARSSSTRWTASAPTSSGRSTSSCPSFGNQVAPFEFPIGEEHDFEGVVDFLHDKADRYPSGPKAEESDWPEEIHAKADPLREKLIEAVAESDDALIERYLEEGTLPEDDIVKGAKAAWRRRGSRPSSSAPLRRGSGIDRLLDLIVDEFPSPARPRAGQGDDQGRRGAGRARATRTGRSPPSCSRRSPTPTSDRSSCSGSSREGPPRHLGPQRDAGDGRARRSALHDARQGARERLRGAGGRHRGRREAARTPTPVTRSPRRTTPCSSAALELPEPLLAYAIEPKTKGDEDKLSTASHRLHEEDPTFRVERNAETHETVMYGMGEAHLDVRWRACSAKFGVEVEATAREDRLPGDDPRQGGRRIGRHVKQSGGHGQYAVCQIEVEPLPRGEGFEYVDKIFGGAIPQQFIPSVEKGILKTMSEGDLTGHPMVDIKVTLVDGKFHTVDSSDMAFQIAGSLGLKEAVQQAGVVLLEPVVRLEVMVPDSMTGDIMGDLNAKRGKVQGMDQLGGGKQGSTRRSPRPRSRATRSTFAR